MSDFITYKQALALKELSFDEPCFGTWDRPDKLWTGNPVNGILDIPEDIILAPLYQQAFRWFRENHGLHYCIIPEFYVNGINFNWQILWYLPKEKWTEHNVSDGTFMYGDNGEYPTQELAENACLDKLIEIVKNKQD